MARMHGSDVRTYLGGRDASADLMEVSPKVGCDTEEDTNFASSGWHESLAGLFNWVLTFVGFHDPAVGGFGRQMETLLTAPESVQGILSVYDGDADAAGDTGLLFPVGSVDTQGKPIKVAEIVRDTGSIKGSGKVGLFARLLHPLAARVATGNTTGYDNAALTSAGGRGNLHVTAITGSWTIKIQHSTDNSTWGDLIAFTQVTAAGGVTAQSLEAAGTVNRYLRVLYTADVAGSCTFVCGFARY